MYAVARINRYDPEKFSASSGNLDEFDRIHRAQHGYVGTATVDLRDGRHLVLNLWESEEDAAAALRVVGPEVGRLLAPLMSGPSELLGTGDVLFTDLAPRADSG
jgi:hypothetical protein